MPWSRFGLVARWVSEDPARNRFRVYALWWEPSLFGPALRAQWGRASGFGPLHSRTWWPDAQGNPPEAVERILIARRLAHGYVEIQRGPAWPQQQALPGASAVSDGSPPPPGAGRA